MLAAAQCIRASHHSWFVIEQQNNATTGHLESQKTVKFDGVVSSPPFRMHLHCRLFASNSMSTWGEHVISTNQKQKSVDARE
jgi:hypothetical protein